MPNPSARVASGTTATWVVTSTADSGPETLRQHLQSASHGDTVTFDPAVFPPAGSVSINLTSQLPALIQGNLTIDASNTNVILDGGGTPGGAVGISVDSDSNTIKGIQVQNFPANGMLLTIKANHNTIGGDTTVGTGPNGEGNVISANALGSGLEINGSDNIVQGNVIGTYAGFLTLGNTGSGIGLKGARNVVGGLEAGMRNVISANEGGGIHLQGENAINNTILGNFIGTDASGTLALANTWGILIDDAPDNSIGPENVIANNGDCGIQVQGSFATGNTITRNSITNNTGKGIELSEGGNIELTPPAITLCTATSISGTASPNCTIEIFSDPEDEGKAYEGTTTSDSTGAFTFIKAEGLMGQNVTATATDTAGNTSEFSAEVPVGVDADVSHRLPARFGLFQNYPNPFNACTEIRYQLPEDGHLTLQISNILGQKVRTLVDAQQKAGEYVVWWNGRDSGGQWIASGLHFCRLKGNDFRKTIKMVLVK